MRFAPLWGSFSKIALGTAVMSGVVAGGWWGLSQTVTGRMADVIAVAGLIPLGCAVYGATLWVLRIEGREEALALLAKIGRRANGEKEAAP
jgi:putative peptidoglycan lipid II flippase